MKTKSSIKIKFFILAFAVTFLAVSLFAAGTVRLSKIKNAKTVFSSKDNVSKSESNFTSNEDNMNLLLIVTDESNTPELFSIVGVSPRNLKINIASLSPKLTLPNRESKTLLEIFEKHGAKYTVESISELLQIKSEKFVQMPSEKFLELLSLGGSIDVSIPEEISYTGDEASIKLINGQNRLDSMSLYYAMIYKSYSNGENARMKICSESLAKVSESLFSYFSFDNGESLFNFIVNFSKTNLNRIDFEKGRKTSEAFSSLEESFAVPTQIFFERTDENEKNDSFALSFSSMNILHDVYG